MSERRINPEFPYVTLEEKAFKVGETIRVTVKENGQFFLINITLTKKLQLGTWEGIYRFPLGKGHYIDKKVTIEMMAKGDEPKVTFLE